MADSAMIARFEKLGPQGVRTALASGGFPTSFNVHALEWLAIKDQEERERDEASEAEQMEIARSAKDAAWVSARAAERSANEAATANARAKMAIIIAAASIIASIIGVLVSHFDTLHK